MQEKTVEELQEMIDDARGELSRRTEQRRKDVIAQIHALAASINVTVKIDAGNVTPMNSRLGRKVPIKYQHPETGESWSGRGMKPKWLTREIEAGADQESFRVAA